jgi:phosphonatase-like hydrolase
VQLVIFDLMGTLVSNVDVVTEAYSAALAEAGLTDGSDEHATALNEVRALLGRPTLDVLTEVLGDAVRAEEATWAFDDLVIERAGTLLPVDGAAETLEELQRRGILAAVTTSFSADVRKAVLTALGWSDRFAAQLSAHGQHRGHPAPDLLLEAILELHIDSVGQVAVVGDTIADLEAGNRAGSGLVIGVTTGAHTTEQLLEAPHTHLVDSVADVPSVLDSPRTVGHRRSADR